MTGPIGPSSSWRVVSEAEFLDRATIAARACGVTRLADITGLDRLGMPVWQAVRPAGRALSVHQGKGATPLAARIGALCEAIESHSAERALADGPFCTFGALPNQVRAPEFSDYARDRARISNPGALAWCQAVDLGSGTEAFLPHAVVSLDFTCDLDGPFDRSSSGLTVGGTESETAVTGICELIERDVVAEWQRASIVGRIATEIDLATIPYDWFGHWHALFRAQGIVMQVHAPASIAGIPVLVFAMAGPAEFGGGLRTFMGSAAHASPEQALFRALAEAVQSRLTMIAGVRDDIYPLQYQPAGPRLSLPVPPAPPGFDERHWDEIVPGPACLDALVGALVTEGYGQVIAKRLAHHLEGLVVMKLFIPGLGGPYRTRRAPQ